MDVPATAALAWDGLGEQAALAWDGLGEQAALAWDGLGEHSGFVLRRAEVLQVELAMREPVRTARSTHRRRPVVLVHVVGEVDGRPAEGWGECAALADRTYDREDVSVAFALVGGRLLAALVEACGPGRLLPAAGGLGTVRAAASASPLSYAAVEAAVGDAHLRAEERSFAALLGVEGTSVSVGAVVGTAGDLDELVGRVGRLVGQGYGRVKMKIGPGSDAGPVRAVREAFPGLRLQVDANESYTEAEGDALAALDGAGLDCIEQPFDRRDLGAHARLARRMRTPICLDESLTSPEAVSEALAAGACSVVCLKPARLGGIAAAIEVIRRCADAGVPVWIGGMYETVFARGVNAVLAALAGPDWPGDLAPPDTYLLGDPWSGTRAAGLWGVDRSGALTVATGSEPGLGPLPVRSALESVVTRRSGIDAR